MKHRWYVDPAIRTLSVFELAKGAWIERAIFCDEDVIDAPPFERVRIAMKEWWAAPAASSNPKLVPSQMLVLDFLQRYIDLHGRAPAEHEIELHLALSPPVVHGSILALEKKGFIERTPGKARSVRILRPPRRAL